MPDASDRRVVVVDGSNLATEGRTIPSLRQLDEAVQAYALEDPGAEIVVVVDASFEHRIDASEREELVSAELHGEVVSPPAGAIGRGDAFVLRIAERTGARVLSNDSFQEFHAEHPWLFDAGRLVGGKPVPGVGWIFTPRIPVRGPKSRQVTGKKKRGGTDALSPPVKAAELARAAKKVAARKLPGALPDGTAPRIGDVWPVGTPGARNGSARGRSEQAAPSTPVPELVEPARGDPGIAERGRATDGAQGSAAAGEAERSPVKKGATRKAPAKKAAQKVRAEVIVAEAVAAPASAAKETATKRAATKKAAAKETATKKAATKKAAAKETATKKAAAMVTATKRAATKKAAAKETATKKAATKKAAAKETATKKAAGVPAPTGAPAPAVAPVDKAVKKTAAKAPAQKAAAKKAAAEQTAAKRAAAKKTTVSLETASTAPPTEPIAARTAAREDPVVQEAIDRATAEALSSAPLVDDGLPAERPAGKRRGGDAKAGSAKEKRSKGTAKERVDKREEKEDAKRSRRRHVTALPAVNEPLAFITFVASYPLLSEIEGEVVSFTSHGAMVDVDLPDGGLLHCYIPLTAMGEPPPTKARQVLAKGERRSFVLVGLDPPRRVAELALPGVRAGASADAG